MLNRDLVDLIGIELDKKITYITNRRLDELEEKVKIRLDGLEENFKRLEAIDRIINDLKFLFKEKEK